LADQLAGTFTVEKTVKKSAQRAHKKPSQTDKNPPQADDNQSQAGDKSNDYVLPDYKASWGLSRAVYDKAVTEMDLRGQAFHNKRYVVVIDFSKHSSKARFFLFDLQAGTVERYHVAHAKRTDPKRTGYAQYFSNQGNTHESSLGAYQTMGTYYGHHGLQLRLNGLESSDNNALRRGIVVHSANYVSERRSYAGLSWGCPALDPRVAPKVISRIKGGALLLIWK
jgi:hypothetical protein